MNILLTGASGFIGLPCLHQLASRGHKVTALARSSPPENLPPGFVWRQGSLNDFSWLHKTISDVRPDAVIHLAWEGIPDFSLSMCLRNFESGVRLCESILASGCRHLVVSGSCWEYGKVSGLVSEQKHVVNPGVFGATKNAQRLVIKSLVESAGATLAWGRIFYPYGPRQKPASLAPTLCRSILAGAPPSLRSPQAVNDFLYVDDTADALILLAETKANGIFNIGSGEGTAVGKMADEMLRLLQKPPAFAHVNETGDGAGFFADITALKNLGWTPKTSLSEGLRNTLAFFQS
jgi:nucleoside-diphosphate-sugar epimerase